MSNTAAATVAERDRDQALPLLFQKREAVVLDPKLGGTTVCQTTAASDYTPDD